MRSGSGQTEFYFLTCTKPVRCIPSMRAFIIAIFFIRIIHSCGNKDSNSEVTRHVPVEEAVHSAPDSLDKDTSDFERQNFPDSVKSALYSSNHRLIALIINSYDSVKAGDTLFSFGSLKSQLYGSGYVIDTSVKNISFVKSDFNRREILQFLQREEELEFTVCTRLWYSGIKYELIWLWFPPVKKDETVYDGF